MSSNTEAYNHMVECEKEEAAAMKAWNEIATAIKEKYNIPDGEYIRGYPLDAKDLKAFRAAQKRNVKAYHATKAAASEYRRVN